MFPATVLIDFQAVLIILAYQTYIDNMKKLIICTLALPLLLGMAACKKDKNNNTGGGTAGNTYTASITSASAKLDGTAFPVESTSVSSSGGISTIYLSSPGAATAIALYFTNNTAAGTYPLSSASGFPGLTYNDGTYFTGSSGSIIVSSNDTVHKVMKGTFAGTVTNNSSGASHVISDGVFTMNYQ